MTKKITTFRDSNRKEEFSSFMNEQFLGNLASSNGSEAILATVFFVADSKYIYFKSRTESMHSLNFQKNDRAAFSVYSHDSNYEAKYGVQIKGTVSRILDESLMATVVNMYSKRFEGSGAKLPSILELCSPGISSTFYKLEIQQFKIIDEDKVENRTMPNYVNF